MARPASNIPLRSGAVGNQWIWKKCSPIEKMSKESFDPSLEPVLPAQLFNRARSLARRLSCDIPNERACSIRIRMQESLRLAIGRWQILQSRTLVFFLFAVPQCLVQELWPGL
jgi:hypothetical protein